MGIVVDEMWWFLAPVREWSWEDEGLRIGSGQSAQGSLCLEVTVGTGDLRE